MANRRDVRKILAPLVLFLAALPALAQQSYSSVASGDWHDPMIWGGAGFPVAGDTVTVNAGDTVTITAAAAAATLEIRADGELAEAGTSTFILSGDLVNRGTITRSRTASWTVGQVAGDFANHGSYRHDNSGNVAVANGDLLNAGTWHSTHSSATLSVPVGTLVLGGDMTHTGAITVDIGLMIPAGVTLDRLGGTGSITLNRGDFANHGEYLHTGSGNLTVNAGSFLNAGDWSSSNGGAVVSVPNGTFVFSADMRHDGGITVGAGGMTIPVGVTLNRGAGSGTITVQAGDFTNRGGHIHTGTGNLVLTAGSFLNAGAWSSSSGSAAISVPNGTFGFTADMTHAGPITVGVGGFTVPAGLTYTHSGTGAVSADGGIVVRGTLNRTGSGVFTVNSGDFANHGSYTNSGTGGLNISSGNFSHDGALWFSSNGSAAVNVPNGTFGFTADMTHAGGLTVGVGGLTVPAGVVFTKSGTGAVGINGGVVINGTLHRSGSGVFTINTGDFLNAGSYTNTSTGDLVVVDGDLTNAGALWNSTSGSAAANVANGALSPWNNMAHAGAISVGVGGLAIPDSVTFDHLAGTGAITVPGDFVNHGTVLGTSATPVLTVGGDFSNTGSYEMRAKLDLAGDFHNTGIVLPGTGTSTTWSLGGSLTNEQADSARFATPLGVMTFTGTEAAALASASPLRFRNLTVRKPGGRLTMTDNLLVEANLVVEAGAFDIAGHALTLGRGTSAAGAVTVAPGAAFLAVGDEAGEGGVVTAAAEAANRAYAFTVNGTIAARNARFERMSAAGIRITGSGAIAEAPNNFSGCTFDYGIAEAPMLWIDRELDSDIAMDSVTFNAGTPTARNIKKAASGTGRVMVRKSTGPLWGEPYELDPDGPNPAGLIDWIHRDVGVVRILAPAGVADSGYPITPAAVVRNFGLSEETFPVFFTIGADYADSTELTIAAGGQDTVRFTDWTPHVPGRYDVTGRAALEGDMNPGNDELRDSVLVRPPFRDAGVTAIVAPAGCVDSGAVVMPVAVVRNFGTHEVAFPVFFAIGGDYSDSATVRLAAGASDTVRFADWTATAPGRYEVSCRTRLAGDENPGNDELRDTVEVVPPAAVSEPEGLPVEFALGQVRPTPFRTGVSLSYALPQAARVELAVYNTAGMRVRTLVRAELAAGRYVANWDGRDDAGRELTPGVYLCRFEAGEVVQLRKLTRL